MSGASPRPAVADPAPWAFPVPEHVALDNGLTVLAVHLPGQHVLALRVALPLPLAEEPRGREGVGLLLARCLDEGTARHSAEALAERLERSGIAFGAAVSERGLVADVGVTAGRLELAAGLLTEILTEPVFPRREVAREVRRRLADIAYHEADPGATAVRTFEATYHGPDDRASRPIGGLRETVCLLTPDDLVRRHAAAFHPDRATVVLAGDLTGVDWEGALRRTLGTWAPSPSVPDAAAEPPTIGRRAPDAARVVLVDRPHAVQTELVLGRPGPSRRDRYGWGTYQALSVLLGGSPHARIDQVLREEKGWTYGLRAAFRPRADGGVLVVSGAVRGDATAPALEVLLEVLDLRGEQITDAEVHAAAAYVARTAPGRYALAADVAAEIAGLALDGLDPEFVTTSVEQARTLSPGRARDAWDAHLGPGWTVVLVGDADHASAIEAVAGPVQVVGQTRERAEATSRTTSRVAR